MRKKYAFTLAETLTVLMVIGVVAALLVPALNANVEKQKNISALKRLYSSFSVNIQTVLNAKNCSSISCLRAYPPGIAVYDQDEYSETVLVTDKDGNQLYEEDGETPKTAEQKRYEQLRTHVFANPKYISVTKECEDYDCTPSAKEGEEEPERVMCNECLPVDSTLPTGDPNERNGYRIYRLHNGAVMALYNYDDGNCITTGKVTGVDVCGIVVFDVNGSKSPNTPGKDLFAFYIADEAVNDSYLVPIGYNNYNGISSFVGDGTCSPNRNDNLGYNCTAKIMIDGWKIKY